MTRVWVRTDWNPRDALFLHRRIAYYCLNRKAATRPLKGCITVPCPQFHDVRLESA